MSEAKRYSVYPPRLQFECGEMVLQEKVVLESDYDALAAQRDEALAREAELNRRISALEGDGSWGEMALTVKVEALQQRLAEAKRLLLDVRGQLCGPDQRTIDVFLASSGCADKQKSE